SLITNPQSTMTAFPDLRSFLDRLRADGDLVTIDAPVDAYLEAAEIHRRVIAAGGPALLFTNVRVGTPNSPPGSTASPTPPPPTAYPPHPPPARPRRSASLPICLAQHVEQRWPLAIGRSVLFAGSWTCCTRRCHRRSRRCGALAI